MLPLCPVRWGWGAAGDTEEPVSPPAIAMSDPSAGLFSHVSISLSVPGIPPQRGWWRLKSHVGDLDEMGTGRGFWCCRRCRRCQKHQDPLAWAGFS